MVRHLPTIRRPLYAVIEIFGEYGWHDRVPMLTAIDSLMCGIRASLQTLEFRQQCYELRPTKSRLLAPVAYSSTRTLERSLAQVDTVGEVLATISDRCDAIAPTSNARRAAERHGRRVHISTHISTAETFHGKPSPKRGLRSYILVTVDEILIEGLPAAKICSLVNEFWSASGGVYGGVWRSVDARPRTRFRWGIGAEKSVEIVDDIGFCGWCKGADIVLR